MNSKLYKHKKTGKIYSLIQEDIKVKHVPIYNEEENRIILDWDDGFVLYKAEYDNPGGPFFVRYKQDFYENFEEIDN